MAGMESHDGVVKPPSLSIRHERPCVLEIDGVLRTMLFRLEQQRDLGTGIPDPVGSDPSHVVEVGDEAWITLGLPPAVAVWG